MIRVCSVFDFLKIFGTFDGSSKNLEKTKKQNCTTHGLVLKLVVRPPWGLQFCFFWPQRKVLYNKHKEPRNQNIKNTNTPKRTDHTPRKRRREPRTWDLTFWNLLLLSSYFFKLSLHFCGDDHVVFSPKLAKSRKYK